MARICEITGKKPISGNNVSHANNKTKRRFLPNLQKKRIWDEELGMWVTLKITPSAMRTISKKGLSAVLRDLRNKK